MATLHYHWQNEDGGSAQVVGISLIIAFNVVKLLLIILMWYFLNNNKCSLYSFNRTNFNLEEGWNENNNSRYRDVVLS